jgi:hypothetical protein
MPPREGSEDTSIVLQTPKRETSGNAALNMAMSSMNYESKPSQKNLTENGTASNPSPQKVHNRGGGV